MMEYKIVLVAVCTTLIMGSSIAKEAEVNSQEKVKYSKHWLLDEGDKTKRINKLETYLRGFDQPMLEVGQRYESLYQALQDENYDFAAYQWKKIKKTIDNGLMKRPARRKSADLFLLNQTWKEVFDNIMSKDKSIAWKGFDKATVACLSCHAAEGVSFVNNQPLFRLRVNDKK
ncbi:hypothetical protein ESZ36_00115 [Colwellia demingiae]|uniref:Uncharacterized protein n=1 Tax=Colwellia demingiae TaxID=89401 RepID=A0A5C6QS52_9GAMM|nr:hypothetical protein [Colwellia demingiae]TWX71679.1 hypothetical protein ESZ36_00115 [Colwellia demingiae]